MRRTFGGGSTGGGGDPEPPTDTRALLFDLPFSAPSLAALEGSLTIGGQTVAPQWSFRARDALATSWSSSVGGISMTLAGAGSNPTPDGELAPCDGDNDKAVRFNTTPTKNYRLSSGAHMIADGHDAIIEVVGRNGTATDSIFNGRGASAGVGLTVTASTVAWALDGQSGLINFSSVVPAASWFHSLFVIDGRTKANHYLNGVPLHATGYDISSITSLVDASPDMTIGYRFGDVSGTTAVAWLSQWTAPAGWLPSAVIHEWARARFALLCGLIPDSAFGSRNPITLTRTGATHRRRYVGGAVKLVPVGANWLRVDSDGTDYALTTEGASGNSLTYSGDLNNAAWTKNDCTVTQAGAPASVITTQTPWGIIGSVASAKHSVSQTGPGVDQTHILSAIVKKGAKDWVGLSAKASPVGCYFNLATGAVGSAIGAGVGAIEALGDGVYRCSVAYAGGASVHAHHVFPASSDGSDTYTGDGASVDTWVYGVQHEELAAGVATPYMRTDAAAVTRGAEVLCYSATGNVDAIEPSVIATVKATTYDATARAIVACSDEQTSNAIVLGGSAALDAEPRLDVTVDAGAVAAIVASGSPLSAWRALDATAKPNDTSLLIAGAHAAGSPDATSSVPVTSVVHVAATAAGATPHRGRVRALQLRGAAASNIATEKAGDAVLVVGRTCATVGMPVEVHFPPLVDHPFPATLTFALSFSPALAGTPTQDTERWTYTPQAGDIGEHTMTVVVSEAGVELGRRISYLTVAANSLTAARRVLVIGDSVAKDGRWQQRVQALSADVTFIGHTTTTNGAIPTAAISGTTAYYHIGSSSPFWYSGALNCAQYITASLGGVAPDIILFCHGTNDMRTEGVAGFSARRMLASYRTLMAAWASAAPAAKQVVCYSAPIGIPYASVPAPLEYQRRMSVGYDALLRGLPGARWGGAFSSMDRATHWTAGDPLHPNASGYTRLGEAMWDAIAVADRT